MNLNVKKFDLLPELARLGFEHDISFDDPQVVAKLTTLVRSALSESLSDSTLLYGKRTEAMFEALLVSLGGYSLLTAEDKGRVHPDGQFHTPDFRVVLPDGKQWLIEVKNVYENDPFRQKRRLMKRDYLNKLKSYASITGGQLKLAIFWARWGIWTLVSPERLVDGDGNVTIDIETGMKLNELSSLGDLMVGTRPQLRFRVEADPTKTATWTPDGMANFTISKVRMYCGEAEILDPIEQQIAWIFMQYGEWQENGPQAITEEDQLAAIEFQWEPEETTNQGFEIIGTLSRMFSRYYAEQTLNNGKVARLHAPLRPKWFEPLLTSDYQGKELPLWRFSIQPTST